MGSWGGGCSRAGPVTLMLQLLVLWQLLAMLGRAVTPVSVPTSPCPGQLGLWADG